MDSRQSDAAAETTVAFDTLARSLRGPLPRRRALGLLAAALASGVFGISRHGSAEAKGTSIPPNCIYVCCDGTCDSWKMCMRCVKWPKGTTTAALAGE